MSKGKFRYKKHFRIKKRRSILKNRFFWFGFFFLAVLGGIFYLFIFSSVFQIKEIKVAGAAKIPPQDIKNMLDSKISRNFFTLKSRSLFLVDAKKLSQNILSDFLWISSANIKKVVPNVLAVEVRERTAAGRWCRDQDCFYFDKTGMIFEKTEEPMKPLLKSELSEFKVYLGRPALEEKYIVSILEINKTLEEGLRLEINEFVASGDGRRLKAETAEGWRILFDLSKENNAQEQLVNFKSVLEEKIPPEKRRNLDYVDLRFGNRVYYKAKD